MLHSSLLYVPGDSLLYISREILWSLSHTQQVDESSISLQNSVVLLLIGSLMEIASLMQSISSNVEKRQNP
jgi:hypothetical protein